MLRQPSLASAERTFKESGEGGGLPLEQKTGSRYGSLWMKCRLEALKLSDVKDSNRCETVVGWRLDGEVDFRSLELPAGDVRPDDAVAPGEGELAVTVCQSMVRDERIDELSIGITTTGSMSTPSTGRARTRRRR
jgi:hypothetical protein